MPIPVFIIDTFTSKAFAGNPTAVCLETENLSAGLKAAIAAELNLPVTAFIGPLSPDGDYEIFYFTPTTEIPACGHATLAAAQVARIVGRHRHARFFAPRDVVIATVSDDDRTTLTYPQYELAERAVEREILESLRIGEYRTAGFCRELEALFIEVETAAELKNIRPDFARLAKSSAAIKEVVVTAESDDERYDYLLRSFCPWIGIDEDPVTGSVHSVLAGFWKSRTGKADLVAYQASARGGELFVGAFDEKVELGGRSVLILRGEITI